MEKLKKTNIILILILVLFCSLATNIAMFNKNKQIDIIVEQKNELIKSNDYLLTGITTSMDLLIFMHDNGAFKGMDSSKIDYMNDGKKSVVQYVDSSVVILEKFYK